MDRAHEPAGRQAKAQCDLHDLPGFGDIPEEARQELRSICRRKVYAAGQVIAEIGVPLDFIGIVRDGIIRMQKSLPDGRQHVVGLLVDGDVFGRVFDGETHFSIEAATEAEVFTFRRGPFEAILLRTPELERAVLLNLLNELDRARDWMIILSHPKVRGRLAGFLLLLCIRFRSVDHVVSVVARNIRVRIPLVRPDVAHLLGTRVESVSRALHALADDGLITILRPDLIEIRDPEALAQETGDTETGDLESLRPPAQGASQSPD